MQIKRYHFLHSHTNLLESEVQLENGDVVYPNIWLPDKNGVMIGKDHPFYGAEDVYNTPLQQVISHDESSEDDFRYVMDERENFCMFDDLIKLWNQNPVFDPDPGWKAYPEYGKENVSQEETV